MSSTLFPIDYATEYLVGNLANVSREGLTVRWPHYDGETEIAVRQVDERTSDGYTISEVVTVTHTSPALASLSPAMCAAINSWALLSALTPDVAGESTRLQARIGIFSADRGAAERLYAPLLVQEATIIGWYAAHIGRGIFTTDPDTCPFRMVHEDPPYHPADYEALKHFSDQYGHVGSTGGCAYTVEFPWDPGARTRMLVDGDARHRLQERMHLTDDELDILAGRTSLLTIHPETHPLVGRGLQCKLEIPLPADEPASAAIIAELNRWELSGSDLPPHIGAWCTGPRSMAYVSFVPTQLYLPGLPHNLLVWSAARHARVRQWLEMSRSAH